MEELHLFLNDCRKKSGWSIEEFAALANIDYKTMQSILSGKSTPSVKSIIKIAEVLMIDYLELLKFKLTCTCQPITLWEDELQYLYRQEEYSQVKSLLKAADILQKNTSSYESSASIEKIKYFYNGLLIPIENELKKSEDFLKEALFIGNTRTSISDFHPKNILDSRILSNIAICESLQMNFDLALKLYMHSECPYPSIEKYEPLRLLNLSITFHRLNRHLDSLECANKGIQCVLKGNDPHLLERFYYRKGIAEYIMGFSQYIYTLQNILFLEEIKMIDQEHESMIKSLANIYGIVRKGNIFIQE